MKEAGKPFRIALIGECMIELQEVGPGDVQQTFGGDTLNTAIYMARVGKELPVHADYVTALGTDPFSEAMMRFWEKEGVGSSMVQCVEGKRPGLYYIQLDEAGERYFHYWRGEAAVRSCFEYPGSEEVLERLGGYDAIYLSGISLAVLHPKSLDRLLVRLKDLREEGVAIHFDCNYRPLLWGTPERAIEVYRHVFPLAHTVLLNVEEGEILLGKQTEEEMHAALNQAGVAESVVRNEAAPCSLFWEGAMHMIPARKLGRVVDSTAAGDSFSAAYLTARWFGVPGPDAVQFAHETAAHVISHKGAIAPAQGTPVLKHVLEKIG